MVSALREKLGAATQVGLDGIELFENDLISYPHTRLYGCRRSAVG